MRMVEKMIQQVILAGMRKNPNGRAFKLYCDRIANVVNTQILGRSECNSKNGQWQVPLDKNDNNKLGDVKLSGHASTKFMNNFMHLVKACTQ